MGSPEIHPKPPEQNEQSEAERPGIPWADWKAELNRLFREQGTSRQSGRITAETVLQGGQSGRGMESCAEPLISPKAVDYSKNPKSGRAGDCIGRGHTDFVGKPPRTSQTTAT